MKTLLLVLAVFSAPFFSLNAQEDNRNLSEPNVTVNTARVDSTTPSATYDNRFYFSRYNNLHLKNPNAAGRNLERNRAQSDLDSTAFATPALHGPAYKNRKFKSVTGTVVPVKKKKRLMGPRYKNRSAKSGRG
ncbi:hypothetical protein [Neolewinella antarctica]|uniref:Uncharacterized protein n=1 Tax=Neolewinella antarctica TaxID=442734 RepID=A0ABX0XBX4_9BACT|nr:hypothetical protein [Neolewinella antarctica]NJC26761.1 hypothetical protein [Neolewinella antarctica]